MRHDKTSGKTRTVSRQIDHGNIHRGSARDRPEFFTPRFKDRKTSGRKNGAWHPGPVFRRGDPRFKPAA